MIVLKKRNMKQSAALYLKLLSEGKLEEVARNELRDCGVLDYVFALIAMASSVGISAGMFWGWLLYVNGLIAQGRVSDSGGMFLILLIGLPLMVGVPGLFRFLMDKRLDMKYSRKNLFKYLSDEDQSKVVAQIAKQEKEASLVLEYKKDEKEFLNKYLGGCTKEMLFDTRELVANDPKKIVNLANPQSAEYKQIKPQTTIQYKV